jgi:hypothetical protein
MLRDRAPTGVFFTPVSSLTEWAVKDSNLRRLLPADLQSAPFGHLGNRPGYKPLPARDQRWTSSPGRQPSTEADDGNRTHNLPLTRRLLCRLSYVGDFLYLQ